jgi:predicted MFS family arabinose efflux permease
MTALIMIGATVAYFAIAIPLAMWIGKCISRRNEK